LGVAAMVALVLIGGSTRAGSAGAGVQTVPGGAQLVGEAGEDLSIGIVLEQRRAVAFATDGKTIGVWLGGSVGNGSATLSDPAGNKLTLTLAPGSARGTLQLAGRASARVSASSAAGGAGLYASARRLVVQARTTEELTSWVRLRDGRVRGVKRLENPVGAPTVAPVPQTISGGLRITPERLLKRCASGGTGGSYPPGCRLPAEVGLPHPASGLRVIANPKGARVTAAELRAIATATRTRVRSRLQEEGFRFLSDADRQFADGWAANLRKNAKVLQAATSLRAALLSGDIESVSRRQGAFEDAVVQTGLTMPESVRRRAAALAGGTYGPLLTPPRPAGTPRTTIVLDRDDFAITDDRSSHGDFATFPTESKILHASPDPSSIVVVSRVSVGFTSDGEIHDTLVGRFDVPAGVQQVEVELAGRSQLNEDSETWCLPVLPQQLGVAVAGAMMYVDVERQTANGSTVVAGDGYLDTTSPYVGPNCAYAPVPDPVMLAPPWPRTIRFAPPAAGGSYHLNLSLHANATVIGLGSADAEAYLELNRATVRFRR
jgi:hypothetical protein